MGVVADLHLHSKFSRAVSSQMVLPVMAEMAKIKGIDVLATGDFTHPDWFAELSSQLTEQAPGVYAVKGKEEPDSVRYIVGGEISCIYTQGGKGRRIHVIILLPSLEVAARVNQVLKDRGCNLRSDGRPIINLSVIQLCELLFSIDPAILLIPAHIWTPWFGMLGAKSGFDSVRESCGENADNIYAVETGLSSNPEMNWRISELHGKSILSFSDAHSPEKLGRELTVFSNGGGKSRDVSLREFTYSSLRSALQNKGGWEIERTIEFYPEQGKYHVDGHRTCGIRRLPEEIARLGRSCPVCGKLLTPGVCGRVEQLADTKVLLKKEKDAFGVVEYTAEGDRFKPYCMLVPLSTILSEVYQVGEKSKKVVQAYGQLIPKLGSELGILTKAKLEDIESAGGNRLAEAVVKVRTGDIFVSPGFDGEFGKVKIFPTESDFVEKQAAVEQETLF